MEQIKIVKHRNGSETRYRRTRLGLAEVARRFAIWKRVLPVGMRDSEALSYGIHRETHGSQTITRLHVFNRETGRDAWTTKTGLGEYFGAYLLRLDENGVEFWDNESRPNRWVLADVFAI